MRPAQRSALAAAAARLGEAPVARLEVAQAAPLEGARAAVMAGDRTPAATAPVWEAAVQAVAAVSALGRTGGQKSKRKAVPKNS